jgi:hypothetical protein
MGLKLARHLIDMAQGAVEKKVLKILGIAIEIKC